MSEPVTTVATPIRLEYRYTPGDAQTRFLLGTQQRRLLGRRCSRCAKVYLPPRGVCSMCGAAFTDEDVAVGPDGTVATFAIVNVNFASREVDLPYAAVEVLFDGADTTAQFLLTGVAHDEVRMGMRVRAIWKEGDLEPTLSNVTHVVALDEPDAPYESYAGHV
ncbi:MAG: Zn-ribbon domain-containing OB-fold protein [Actinobacteria bacterium]|nr:Zn-ribbon domain-containing OB-fold protein [Actinomycetota bacterium]